MTDLALRALVFVVSVIAGTACSTILGVIR